MKKVFLIFTLVLVSCLSFGQFQSVLKHTNQSWDLYSCAFRFGYIVEVDSLYIGNPIVYNSVNYNQILSRNNTTYFPFTPGHYGFLREDTTIGKLWFLEDTFSNFNEQLVYDLSLSIGDTFITDIGNTSLGRFIVDSIYNLNGKRRVKLNQLNDSLLLFYPFLGNRNNFPSGFSSYYDTLEFIEGVGSTYGFLNGPLLSAVGYSQYLLCHTKNGIQDYQHNLDTTLIPFIRGCDTIYPPNFTVNLNENQKVGDGTSFYPNPSIGLVNLRNTNQIEEVRVFELNGNMINRFQNPRVIQLPENDGVYIIEIVDIYGSIQREKVIKIPR